MSKENGLIQWGSLQDPVRIKREHAEAHRLAREANTVIHVNEKMVETSKIPQVASNQMQYTNHISQSGKISPKPQGQEGYLHIIPKLGEIPPTHAEKANLTRTTPNLNEIPPKEPWEVTDLVAMEEGARAETPNKKTQDMPKEEDNILSSKNQQQKSPQIDTTQHYLDDNFSDVMRSSALGFNVSSLFNTTAFNTTHNEQKATLDWILLDGKNSQLETLKDKHIADFLAPGRNTGAMLVYLLDLEPFYNTNEFLVDLQSGELFMELKDRWYSAGLTCRKRNFKVDSLMALILNGPKILFY